MQKTISIIIPAHNEEKTLSEVLTTLSKSNLVAEIICINDGSTDDTGKVLRNFPNIQTITLKKNCGKAFAMAQGVLRSKGEVIVFVDADLQGLTVDTLLPLVE